MRGVNTEEAREVGRATSRGRRITKVVGGYMLHMNPNGRVLTNILLYFCNKLILISLSSQFE